MPDSPPLMKMPKRGERTVDVVARLVLEANAAMEWIAKQRAEIERERST